MSLEAALETHAAALNRNSDLLAKVVDNQARLLAGQEAALAKLDTAKPSGSSRGSTKKDDPKPPTEEKKPASETASRTISDDDLRAAGAAWMKGKSETERNDAFDKMNSVLEHFGLKGTKITGPDSKLDADQRKQAWFYIQRWNAGLDVNFSADYDFDGDPKQDAAAPEAESENDPFA